VQGLLGESSRIGRGDLRPHTTVPTVPADLHVRKATVSSGPVGRTWCADQEELWMAEGKGSGSPRNVACSISLQWKA